MLTIDQGFIQHDLQGLKRSNLFLITCCFFFSAHLLGQNVVSFSNYFFETEKKPVANSILEQKGFDPTWIEELEVRTDTDEFDFDQQRYMIRLSPASRKVNTALTKLLSSYEGKFLSLEDRKRNEEKFYAYEKTIQVYNAIQELRQKRSLFKVLEDKRKVFIKLIEAKQNYSLRLLDLQQDISELEMDMVQPQHRIDAHLEKGTELDWSKMIDAEYVIDRLAELNDIEIIDDSEDDFLWDQELIEKEINFRTAESERIFDFIQLEYRGPHTELFRERVSVTAAFRFPLKDNRTRYRVAELRNEQLENTIEYEMDLSDRILEHAELYEELIVLSDKYQMQKEFLKQLELQSENIIRTYSQFESPDPLVRLNQREIVQKNLIRLSDLEGRLISKYYDLLKNSGLLSLDNENNYLVKN